MSYLYMLTGIFGAFAVVVAVLGFRGQESDDRPWHFFLDMKYQPKYTSQGQSRFFADGRSNRLPPEDTVPFDGTDYTADAGRHAEPNPDFLKADRRYYFGVANADAKSKDPDGTEVFNKPMWKDGKLAGRRVLREPHPAAGGREGRRVGAAHQARRAAVHRALRGVPRRERPRRRRRDAHSASSARTGCRCAPANIIAPAIQAQPDGQMFHTITNGVRHDAGLRPPGEGARTAGRSWRTCACCSTRREIPEVG